MVSMLARIVAVASLGGFLFGYDLGLVSGALELIVADLGTSTAQEQLVVAGAKLGAFLGAFVGAALMLSHGRRTAIALSAVPYIGGPVLMTLAPGVPLLTLGRVINGVGVGISAVVVPAYLAEVAPAAHRGAIVSVYEVMLTVGMVASQLVDLAAASGTHGGGESGEEMESAWRWRVMVGAAAVPALLLPLTPYLVPESARWLIMKGDMPAALAAIHRLRGAEGEVVDDVSADEDVNMELLTLWDSVARVDAQEEEIVEQRRERLGGGDDGAELDSNGINVTPERIALQGGDASGPGRARRKLFGGGMPGAGARGPYGSFLRALVSLFGKLHELATGEERYPFWMAIGLAFANQAVASTSIINYSTELLSEAGAEGSRLKIMLSILVTIAKGVGVSCGAYLIDRLGRRPLFVWGSFLIAGAMAGMFVAVRASSVALTVASMSLFMLFFAGSWAGGFWVVVSEIFSMRVKSAAQAVATAALFLFGALTDVVFLSIVSVGPGGLLVFAVVAVGGGAFVWCLLPETRGRTLEEVQAIFSAGARAQIARDKRAAGSGEAGGVGVEFAQLRPNGAQSSSDADIADAENALFLSPDARREGQS